MDECSERWLPVAGYEGLYEVSNLGRVRSVDRWVDHGRNGGHQRRLHGRVIRQVPCGAYRHVSLSKEGRVWVTYPHYLVLTAFVGPRPEGQECLHGALGQGDDSAVNLRWGTPVENRADMTRDGHDHNANKTRCPRRHLLVEPNLIPSVLREGRRSCRACRRAHGDWTEADRQYERIMQGQP